jgi:branched-chain amino acid transport system permease protein
MAGQLPPGQADDDGTRHCAGRTRSLMSAFLQFALSGLTIGTMYALVALGFTIIYNASEVMNFAQGEFVMIGGVTTFSLYAAGVPLVLAGVLSTAIAGLVGLLLYRLAIQPARDASPVTLIIITIGASIFLRGVVQVVVDERFHTLPAFSGDQPIVIGGAVILPQSLWVFGGSVVIFTAIAWFFDRTLLGKALLATSGNLLAAKLVGIDTRAIIALAFVLSAAIGAIGGVLITPIALTSYNVGTVLGLKGFAAAMLGGVGDARGAVVGGLLLGLLETFAAGYLSSDYKDAVAFLLIILVLFVFPAGILGRARVERV